MLSNAKAELLFNRTEIGGPIGTYIAEAISRNHGDKPKIIPEIPQNILASAILPPNAEVDLSYAFILEDLNGHLGPYEVYSIKPATIDQT